MFRRLLGLVLPSLAAAVAVVTRYRARRTQARRSHQMEPLWRALTRAVPFVVLPDQPHGRDAALSGTYHRRLTEITDALAHLAPYYVQAGLAPGDELTGVRDPRTAATIIEAALRAHHAGDGRAEPPFPRIEPDHPSWREHSEWMVATSREFEQLAARAEPASSN